MRRICLKIFRPITFIHSWQQFLTSLQEEFHLNVRTTAIRSATFTTVVVNDRIRAHQTIVNVIVRLPLQFLSETVACWWLLIFFNHKANHASIRYNDLMYNVLVYDVSLIRLKGSWCMMNNALYICYSVYVIKEG